MLGVNRYPHCTSNLHTDMYKPQIIHGTDIDFYWIQDTGYGIQGFKN